MITSRSKSHGLEAERDQAVAEAQCWRDMLTLELRQTEPRRT